MASKKKRNRIEYQREYRKTQGYLEAKSFHNITRSYGITLDQYNAMFEKQNELCAICAVVLQPVGGNTHIDHDHTTGNIRGLLCQWCNIGVGHFKDNPEIVFKAMQYLQKEPAIKCQIES